MRKKLIYYYLSQLAIANIGGVIILINTFYLSDPSHIWGANTIDLTIEGLKRWWQINHLFMWSFFIFPIVMSVLIIIIIFILAKNNTRSIWNVAPHLPTVVCTVGIVSFYLFFSTSSFIILFIPVYFMCSYTVWKDRHKPI